METIELTDLSIRLSPRRLRRLFRRLHERGVYTIRQWRIIGGPAFGERAALAVDEAIRRVRRLRRLVFGGRSASRRK